MRPGKLFQELDDNKKELCKISQTAFYNIKTESKDNDPSVSSVVSNAITKLNKACTEAYKIVGYKNENKAHNIKTAKCFHGEIKEGLDEVKISYEAISSINKITGALSRLDGKTSGFQFIITDKNEKIKLPVKFIAYIKEVCDLLESAKDFYEGILSIPEVVVEESAEEITDEITTDEVVADEIIADETVVSEESVAEAEDPKV